MRGYVYAIQDESARIKLGFAVDVDARILELQTGNAEQLTIVYRLMVEDMKKAEDSLHMLFASSHIRGEWFNLNKIQRQLLEKIFTTMEKTPREQHMLRTLGLYT